MIASHPIAARLIGFVVLPALAAGVFAWSRLGASLPDHEAHMRLAGLRAGVDVRRDLHGTPEIRAASDRDAFFVTGYLHAQDRLWQLEVQRRTARGRLSELLGVDALGRDVWMRTLGLEAAAQSAWDALGPAAREALQAYADGINGWLDSHAERPPEFGLLGVTPEHWTPIDSLLVAKVLALSLAGNADQEIQRFLVSASLSTKQMRTFFRDAQPAGATAAEAGEGTSAELREAMSGMLQASDALHDGSAIGGRYVGSNAWAVSARYVKGEGALLANDPHLGLQMPSPWYALRQQGDRLHVAGMTLVGLPMVIFGQNGDIAWGGTNLMADTQDLYVEQLHPSDPSLYRAGDRWLPFERRTEIFHVRPAFPSALREALEPVKVEVRSTRHGPVLTDAVSALRVPVSLRWVALEPHDRSVEALLQLSYVNDWQGFQAALEGYVAPALNFVYADRSGHIGKLAAGGVPVRATGRGGLPVQGWSGQSEWTGFIAASDLPREFDPPSGFVVSANDDPTPRGYRHHISSDWAPTARADRIAAMLRERLAEGRRLDVAEFRAMQADVLSLPARSLADALIALQPAGDDREREALSVLAGWRGAMARDSAAATLMSAWSAHLKRRLYADASVPSWTHRDTRVFREALADNVSTDQLTRDLAPSTSAWCERDGVAGRPACREVARLALDDALDELRRLAGGSPADWSWGTVHEAVYSHVPFSSVRGLDRVFERRVETGGSPDTVNVADAVYKLGEGYRQRFGAAFRQIMQPAGANTVHRFMNSTGQSGHPLSPHYGDMVEAFRDVRDVALPEPAAAGEAKTSLRLEPADAATR